MNKTFVSQRLLLPKIILYFFLILGLLFLILIPISNVKNVSDGKDSRFAFALLIGIPLLVAFYIFRNYTIKIDGNKVSIYYPFSIKRKTLDLKEITHYVLENEGYHESYNRILQLFVNETQVLKINSYRYANSAELFKKLTENLKKKNK
ncbi:hypothetical protein [Flavobacterium sp.]|uniref:hypothetical protein n=1 Tax=Flavobacterium sp. TaxID=239 RepID=UPI00286CD1B5|nr:hypothetical protein [Flavobacterium sp.]